MSAQPATVPQLPRVRDQRPARRRLRRSTRGWAYAWPTALFVLLLFVLPLGLVLRMSASKWPLLSGDQGINFPDNYRKAVSNRFFAESITFTLKYTLLATMLLIALGLGLASASLLFYVLYSPLAGPFAPVMRRLGLTFLGSPDAALFSSLFLIVWRYAGFYMLLMLVGLQAIPPELYEAARMDGAGRWDTFRRITIPLLRPTLALTTILCVTGSLLAFEQFYILTKGGPDNSTITVVQLIYSMAFQGQNDLGVAGSLSVIVLLALVVVNVVQLRAFRTSDES